MPRFRVVHVLNYPTDCWRVIFTPDKGPEVIVGDDMTEEDAERLCAEKNTAPVEPTPEP